MELSKGGLKLDFNFNKHEFAICLNAAKGERSINRYGTDSGVDPGYISRLLRALLDTAPSAAVIKKLADTAENGVTFQELLAAAGYMEIPAREETIKKTDSMQQWEKVIEEAAHYNITPEAAIDLIRSLGKSMEKIRSGKKE